jgi:transcriptional regulator GlxA family with amidase domain
VRGTIRFIRDLLADPVTGSQSLITNSAARLLAATILTAFPSTAVDDNAHRDISVADIAAAANVSIRTIQLAFRRHLDTTPNAYLRRVRLE